MNPARQSADFSVRIERAHSVADDAWLAEHPPTHVVLAESSLAAPLERVFEFFSRAENLERITPRDVAFEILTPLPIAMKLGALIDYRIRLGPFPVRWRTRILHWEPPTRFVDVQLRGPYRLWWHEHRFESRGSRTAMFDRVYYAVPFGPLGLAANALFVRRELRAIFEFRARAIGELFAGAARADRSA